MRKIIIAASSLAFILAGCSQNELLDGSQNPNNAIGFGVYTPQSRGTETTTATLEAGENFGILASYTGTSGFAAGNKMDFMWNQQVDFKTTNSAGWGYSPLKYWPNAENDKISFFAYAPYSVYTTNNFVKVSDNTKLGYPTIDYSALGALNGGTSSSDNLMTAPDLVTAQVIDQTRINTAVPFTFKHVLTRLGFSARVDHDLTSLSSDPGNASATHVVITKIEIKGTGTGTLPVSGVYTFPATNDGDGVWSNISYYNIDLAKLMDLVPVTITATPANKEYTEAIELPQDGTNITMFGGEGTDASPLQYLFLPPVAAGLATNAVKIEVTYDIVTVDSALALGYSITTATKTASLPQGIMKQGVAYACEIVVGLNKIEVSATVTPWNDPTPADI